jgi:hypothetical protein
MSRYEASFETLRNAAKQPTAGTLTITYETDDEVFDR